MCIGVGPLCLVVGLVLVPGVGKAVRSWDAYRAGTKLSLSCAFMVDLRVLGWLKCLLMCMVMALVACSLPLGVGHNVLLGWCRVKRKHHVDGATPVFPCVFVWWLFVFMVALIGCLRLLGVG